MQTKILSSDQIYEAVELLKNGQVVAIPTETVYGLAGDANNNQAISKIFTAKNRPEDHPLIVHISSFDKLNNWVKEIPIYSKILAKHFWPGPLTMVFNKKESVSNLITGGLETIAIRVPNNKIALEIIKKLDSGLAAPSANTYKKISPTQPSHVLKTLSGKIAAIIDGGKCVVGIESTIIDMTQEIPTILRHGAISAKMIEEVLGIKIIDKINCDVKVSGNMKEHYQPDKPLYIANKKEIETNFLEETNIAIMHYSDIKKNDNYSYYKMPSNKTEYATKLYKTLHNIDATNVYKIIIEKPPSTKEWDDINDRIQKASTKNT